MNYAKRLARVALILSLALPGFGASPEDTTGSQAAQESTSKQERKKKDRGDASMLLGDVQWQATSARAKMKNTTLIISASRMDGSVHSTMVRQSIDMYIPDFSGPGTYEAAQGSMFLVVGLDASATENAEMDKAVVDALMKSKRKYMHGAKVVIQSASDTEIVGSFSLEVGAPKVTKGSFRALLKKKE